MNTMTMTASTVTFNFTIDTPIIQDKDKNNPINKCLDASPWSEPSHLNPKNRMPKFYKATIVPIKDRKLVKRGQQPPKPKPNLYPYHFQYQKTKKRVKMIVLLRIILLFVSTSFVSSSLSFVSSRRKDIFNAKKRKKQVKWPSSGCSFSLSPYQKTSNSGPPPDAPSLCLHFLRLLLKYG